MGVVDPAQLRQLMPKRPFVPNVLDMTPGAVSVSGSRDCCFELSSLVTLTKRATDVDSLLRNQLVWATWGAQLGQRMSGTSFAPARANDKVARFLSFGSDEP